MIHSLVPGTEKDGEEKFENFQKCFQEVLQSCGIAVEGVGRRGDVEKEDKNQLVLQRIRVIESYLSLSGLIIYL